MQCYQKNVTPLLFEKNSTLNKDSVIRNNEKLNRSVAVTIPDTC